MPTQTQPSVIRAILREYHSATHTAEVEPVMGPASLVGEIPVLMSCLPDLLTTGREVAVLTWSDVGALVLGAYGGVPPQSLWGDGSDGAISNLTDTDTRATTVAQTSTVSLTHNRTIRATGNITLSQTITVNKQDGQARGAFPTTHGGPGICLGAVLATIGSKGIPAPIRPGGGNTPLCGGVVQFLSGGTVAIGGAITAQGANAASDGGGGGGLVVVVAKTSITGASTIDVSGADGHATAAARGGAGSYAGEPGGHAGVGGGGGGGGGVGQAPATGGAGGEGIVNGYKGGNARWDKRGGAGGGSVNEAGENMTSGHTLYEGTDGGGNVGGQESGHLMDIPMAADGQDGSNTTGGQPVGEGGAYGGGGGGAAGHNAGEVAGNTGGDGGANGGGGGGGSAGMTGGAPGQGGNGGNGNSRLVVFSSPSVYAGRPGGQGGGGGGGHGSGTGAGTAGTGGADAAGVTGSDGAGSGGAGANGSNGVSRCGGTGGKGGNGGGAAGLVLLISPSITYSGTVTGRLVKITGTDALDFIRGYQVA